MASVKVSKSAARKLGIVVPPDEAWGDYPELADAIRTGARSRPAGRRRGRAAGGKREGMNQTESAYVAEVLEPRKRAGEIQDYHFEAIKLRLGRQTFYNPDFLVIGADGSIEIHEVKGFWEEDARVKIKVAAYLYPFRFVAVKKGKKGADRWQYEEIEG